MVKILNLVESCTFPLDMFSLKSSMKDSQHNDIVRSVNKTVFLFLSEALTVKDFRGWQKKATKPALIEFQSHFTAGYQNWTHTVLFNLIFIDAVMLIGITSCTKMLTSSCLLLFAFSLTPNNSWHNSLNKVSTSSNSFQKQNVLCGSAKLRGRHQPVVKPR